MIVQKKKKKNVGKQYDPAAYTPVIRCSICTGEQVAGFRDKTTGKIEDIMLLQSERDLKKFRQLYGLGDEPIEKVY